MDPVYSLREGAPSVVDYLRLRRDSGLTPKREDQARAALAGTWHAVHAVHAKTGLTVGMGRTIGDGGWYFHIADMAVDPAHQRQGIGDVILTALIDRIREVAPTDPWITLLADEPGRRLYERHGFRPTAPGSIGMAIAGGTGPSRKTPTSSRAGGTASR
jgi:GNAT superfamily N-acetyltransferase